MTILITNGIRPRNQSRDKSGTSHIIATIPRGREFESQDELQTFWEDQLSQVPEQHFVPAMADNGIFAETLRPQIEQITPPSSTYGVSMGLGYVNLDGNFPDFNFGEYESDLPSAVKGHFNIRTWWKFVTNAAAKNLRDILAEAIKARETVIFTVPSLVFVTVSGELAELSNDPELDVNEVVKYLRLIGPDLDSKVPPALLDCVMPYEDAIDRVIPGTSATRSRRIAYLMTRVAPNSDDPVADYRAVSDYIHDAKSPVLQFKSAERGVKPKTQRLEPAELSRLVHEQYSDRCHGIVLRITRMMRHDGYNVSQDEVETALKKAAPKKPAKVAKPGAKKTTAKKPAAKSTEKAPTEETV